MKKSILRVLLFLVTTLFLPIFITFLLGRKNARLQVPNTDAILIYTSNSQNYPIAFEEYVSGIVLASISTNYDYEVLKAQAIIARTYALKNISVLELKSSAALIDVLNQQNNGYTTTELGLPYVDATTYLDVATSQELTSFLDSVVSAVKDTHGQVITYKDELITPLFFSSCGGKTRNSSEIWSFKIPYLRSVDSNQDVESSDFMQLSLFSIHSVIEKLQAAYAAHILDASDYDYQVFETLPLNSQDFFDSVEIIQRDSAGYVLTLSLGGVVVSGEAFANVLSLDSSYFYMDDYEGSVRFQCHGKGHGIGFSQYGAHVLAKSEAYTYEDLLKYYYTGVNIQNIKP